MVVDDNPANLKLLEDMLRQNGYEVKSFPRGRLAIAAAEDEPPDLILLDINMPEMSGYEVCEKFKESSTLSGIPVIFLSALNQTEDKVKGFQSGGVDYISKPFRFEEVQARVNTHLKLWRAQKIERELLEKTLGGVVVTLWELVQLSSPVLSQRSGAIRNIVLWVTRRMGIQECWKYELAATLCLVGCLALPDEVFERAYCGQNLTPEEDRMFQAHPERAARLLSKIPRLEDVGEMIRRQNSESQPRSSHPIEVGAHLLRLALELDRRAYRGMSLTSAVAELRSSRRFDAGMIEALESYSPLQADFDLRRLRSRELRAGMILAEDIQDGSLLILKQGTLLTETWIERLQNFTKTRDLPEMVHVRVPRVGQPLRLKGLVRD